jgi:protein-S-isoprenylcysteine O-methyltransferase Ste14
MAGDDLFRVLFLLAIAALLPFGLYYRIRSQTDEKLDRRQEGMLILVGLRASAALPLVVLVAWLLDAEWIKPMSMPIPPALRWLGIALVGVWGTLVLWTFRHLGGNLTDTVVTRRDHVLVTSGPYRYVRHPFYLAFALAVIGITLTSANALFFLAGAIPFAFLVARTRIEEQKLLERFGAEYRHYSQRVGRFLPRVRF